ncbi:MAG: recombinase family protein [Patescibacteria group bacterium]
MILNKKEAAVVKKIFQMYAKGNIGINKISQYLEEQKIPRKCGGKVWHNSTVKYILQNEVYTGIRYYNTEHYVREYANPIHGIKYSSGKKVYRPREEWIGVTVPQIVSIALFEKVKKRFEWNKKHYRNPKRTQLLSNLLVCGSCGKSIVAYQRYYKEKRLKVEKIYHKKAYRCSYKAQEVMHAKSTKMQRCDNKEIKSELLENCVMDMFTNTILIPKELKKHLEHSKEKTKVAQERMEKGLKAIDLNIKKLNKEKKRILELYATGDLDRDMYGKKSLEYDNEINKVKIERHELIQKIPVLHKKSVIDVSVRQYCELLKAQLEKCTDFETKRQFMLDHVEKIVFVNDHVTLHGFVPVKLKAYEDPDQPSEASKIRFCVEGKIKRIY